MHASMTQTKNAGECVCKVRIGVLLAVQQIAH